MRWKLKVTRDQILFTAGLLGVLHQTVVEHADRLGLLALFATMMGLPLFLGRDTHEAKKDEASPDEQAKVEEK